MNNNVLYCLPWFASSSHWWITQQAQNEWHSRTNGSGLSRRPMSKLTRRPNKVSQAFISLVSSKKCNITGFPSQFRQKHPKGFFSAINAFSFVFVVHTWFVFTKTTSLSSHYRFPHFDRPQRVRKSTSSATKTFRRSKKMRTVRCSPWPRRRSWIIHVISP